MGYIYNVYADRSHDYFMDFLLISPANELISTLFFFIGAVGVAANALVIYIFFTYYTHWRLATRLWVNISANLLCGSVILMYRAIGDHWQRLSNAELGCRLRYLLPISLDICTMGCLMVMLGDRISVIHFPNFYIYNEKNNNTKLMYGWFFGLWFFLVKFFVLDTENMPSMCTTPVSLAFPLEAVSLFTYGLVLATMLVAFQGYVFTPNVNTPLQTTWVKQELKETIRVLTLGLLIATLWAPKYILTLKFISSGVEEFKYQILMMLLYIPARLSVLVPLAVLIRRSKFRKCVQSVLQWNSSREILTDTIAEAEVEADAVLHSVLQAMYPNHPEFTREGATRTIIARQVTDPSLQVPPPNITTTTSPKRHLTGSMVTFEEGEIDPKKDKISWDESQI